MYNRNERVSAENRDVFLTVDERLAWETDALPQRRGPLVVGIDLGGSASLSAAAFYRPETGRLETPGTFPTRPGLLERGQADAVGNRYLEMHGRGARTTLGDRTAPVAPWLALVMRRVEGEAVGALVADRHKQAEVGEAIDKAGIRVPIVWRGQGFRDGGGDCERFRRATKDGRIRSPPSLLPRSAVAPAVTLRDHENNLKLAEAALPGAVAIRADAGDVAATAAAVDEAARRPGGLDIVFAHAGVARFAPLEQVDAAFFDEQMAINARSVLFTAQAAAKHLPEGGAIVVNTSVNNRMGMAGTLVYAATKAAARSLVRTLAGGLAPRGIRVNAVSPGPTETPIYGKLGMAPEQLQGVAETLKGKIVLGRFGTADEIAGAALHLASDDAAFVTGAALVADGGWTEVMP